MPVRYKKPYFDTSVLISWLKGETIDSTDRQEIVTDILTAAERGLFRVYTSTFTMAEVYKQRGREPLHAKNFDTILKFFEHDFVTLIDVDRRAGERAHRLCQQFGIMPGDAVHLPCALKAGCDVLLTWDDRLTGLQLEDIRVEQPRLVEGQMRLPNSDERPG